VSKLRLGEKHVPSCSANYFNMKSVEWRAVVE